jgi:hypothetical protein
MWANELGEFGVHYGVWEWEVCHPGSHFPSRYVTLEVGEQVGSGNPTIGRNWGTYVMHYALLSESIFAFDLTFPTMTFLY